MIVVFLVLYCLLLGSHVAIYFFVLSFSSTVSDDRPRTTQLRSSARAQSYITKHESSAANIPRAVSSVEGGPVLLHGFFVFGCCGGEGDRGRGYLEACSIVWHRS